MSDPYLINVLNNGHVRLLSYMQPVPQPPTKGDTSVQVTNEMKDENWRGLLLRENNSQWTGDLEIVRNARISHDATWRLIKTNPTKDTKVTKMTLNPTPAKMGFLLIATFNLRLQLIAILDCIPISD